MIRTLALATPLLVFSWMAANCYAATIFSDGDMFDNDWVLIEKHNSAADTQFERIDSGGNTGAYRSVTNIGNAGNSSTLSYFFRNGAVFTPGTQGAIDSIDYSEDQAFLSNSGGTIARFQFFSLALLQAGNVYLGGANGFGYEVSNPSSSWNSNGFLGLVESDFRLHDATGSIQGDMQPDFSIAGAPIQFGYLRANSAGGSPQYSITVGIDNWRVEVKHSAIPEPASGLLAVVGLLAFTFPRRRKLRC